VRSKTAPVDGSEALMPDCEVAAFTGPAAVPVEGFTASDNAVQEITASGTTGVAPALAGSALVCHVEHAEIHSCMNPGPLVSDYICKVTEDDSHALYLVDNSAWPT